MMELWTVAKIVCIAPLAIIGFIVFLIAMCPIAALVDQARQNHADPDRFARMAREQH